MSLVQLLEQEEEEIIAIASDSLARARLRRYEEAGRDTNRQQLRRLYDLMVQSVRERDLVIVTDYMEQAAQRRFAAGYDISEVQTAINALEETVWKRIIHELPSSDLAEAIGLVGTVLGAAKDTLARTYVSLASQTKAPSLNLAALFDGTDSIDMS